MTKRIKKSREVVFPTKPITPWPDKFISLIENQLWNYIPEPEQEKWEQIKSLLTSSDDLDEVQQTLTEKETNNPDASQRLIYSHWTNILANVADIREKISNAEKESFYQWLASESHSNFTWPGLVSYYFLKKSDWEEVSDKGTQTDNVEEKEWKQRYLELERYNDKLSEELIKWKNEAGIVQLQTDLAAEKERSQSLETQLNILRKRLKIHPSNHPIWVYLALAGMIIYLLTK